MDTLSELLKVQVDFNQSHLLFPTIVEWLLGLLLLLIALTHGPQWLARVRGGSVKAKSAGRPVDWKRLGGCLALTVVYFAAMEPVGTLRPNTGIGFLLCSIVYGLLLSWLFVHEIDRRKALLLGASSVLTPLVVWALFAYLFKITLP